MRIRHALIMAAGRGQRMMPLTNEIPKAMAIHEGSTLIAKGIDRLHGIIVNIHITVGYKGAMLAKHVIEHRVNSIFNTDGHGNAWWIFNTLLKELDEPLLVLTCDNIVELDTDLLSHDYHQKKEPPCMIVPVSPVKGLEGDYIVQHMGLVKDISRTRPSPIYCSGIQVINPYKINQLMTPKEDFYEVWQQLIGQQMLHCSEVYPKKWFTVDTVEQLNQLNKEG